MKQVEIKPSEFLAHLNAPFFGATHDHNGAALPSKRTKSWVFTLGNERKDNHLTYKATRLKGQTLNEPVEVSLNLHGLNSLYDPVYQTIGTVDSKGTLRIQYGLNLNQPRLDIGYETLVWLLGVSTDQDFEMPDNLQIMCEAKCARCALPLTNPSSLKQAIGPICRKKINKSSPAHKDISY
jgi:hypothetical protein